MSLGAADVARPIATSLIGSVSLPPVQLSTIGVLQDLFSGENLLWLLLLICSFIATEFRHDLMNVLNLFASA